MSGFITLALLIPFHLGVHMNNYLAESQLGTVMLVRHASNQLTHYIKPM